jgi:hypothetical protein
MMLDVAATFRVWRLERRFENVDSRFAGQKSSAGSLGASEYGDGTRSREASRTEKRWQDISASLNIAEKGGTPMRPWIGKTVSSLWPLPPAEGGAKRAKGATHSRNSSIVALGKRQWSYYRLWTLCGRRASLPEPPWLTYGT